MLGYDIDPAIGNLRQSPSQRQSLREQVVTWWKIDQDVDIAVGAAFPPGDRTEHTNSPRAELATRGIDGFFFTVQCVEQHAETDLWPHHGLDPTA